MFATLVQIRIHLRLEAIERLVHLLGHDFIVSILRLLGDALHQSGVPVVRRELARVPLAGVGVPDAIRRQRHHVQRQLSLGAPLDQGRRWSRQLRIGGGGDGNAGSGQFAAVHHGRVVRLRNVRRLVGAHGFGQRRQRFLARILPHCDGDLRRRQVRWSIQIVAVTKYLQTTTAQYS